MPTSESSSVTRAGIQINLTAAGWTVVVMMVVSLLISGTARIAVGFLIPLAAAVVIDLYVSWYFLDRQTISIVPSRTVACAPDGIPVRVTSTGGQRPVRVVLSFPGGDEHEVGLNDEPESFELTRDHIGAIDFIRANISCTVLGLAVAQRWQTHLTPMLHWAPEAEPGRIPTPDAIDDVARLRAYVPGDRMSRVSWPVTARTGQMHVRAAGVGHEEMTIIVNPGESADSSFTLQTATTLAAQLLEDGHMVRLVTTELHPDARASLRRQAVAAPREVPEDPNRVPMLRVTDRFLSDEDDLARRIALVHPGPRISWPFPGAIEVSPSGIGSM